MPGMSRETANAILPYTGVITIMCAIVAIGLALLVFTRLGDRFPRTKNMSMMGR